MPASKACTPCPIGKYCPATDRPLIKECDAGMYAPTPGHRDVCIDCPAYNDCSDKKTATPCPTHFYSLAGWGKCRPCPAGMTCTGSDPIECSAGTYSIEGDKDCHTCPAGSYCPQKSSRPIPCEAGTAQNNPGQGSCNVCASGSYSMLGSQNCITCPAGSYCPYTYALPIPCPLGYYASSGKTTCTKCSDGYACAGSRSVSNPPEDACPLGYACQMQSIDSVNRLVFIPCAKGTYGTSMGQNDQNSACSNCPAGFYCPYEGMVKPYVCPKGYYCSGSNDVPTPCNAGTYNPKTGSIVSTDCVACPSGNYCPAGCDEPIVCQPGYYCSSSSGSPTAKCAAGTYASVSKTTGATDCINCPEGSYCPQGSGSAVPCPAGTYNQYPGKSDINDCLPCAKGTACPTFGNPKDNGVACEPGYYCPAGTKHPLANPCDEGKYSDVYKAEDATVCKDCPAGFICAKGTNRFTIPMQKCPPGYYCELGTTTTSKKACAAGTYQPYYGATDISWCSFKCSPGKYCPEGSVAPAGDCEDGYYCPEGTKTAKDNPCPAGTYSTSTGLKHLSECTICEAGYYCPEATTYATRKICAKGTYQPDTKKGADTDCLPCKEGYFCDEDGMTYMKECGLGKYSGASAQKCIDCPMTYYCNSPTTTKTAIDTNAITCEAGYVCLGSVGEYPKDSLLCPEGHFCLARCVDPTPCEPGTYNPQKGGKDSSACLQTPAGKYSLRGAKAPTGDCAPGFYCEAGSTRDKMTPCPIGKFRSLPNGATVDDCGACPAGYFCPLGTSIPRPCPIGYYCGEAITTPLKCPEGYFGASPLLRTVSQCTKCWAGRFCSVAGLSFPDGSCDPGYYCKEGSKVPNPTDITSGNLCPAGGVCPAGSIAPQPCKPGFYSLAAGLKSTDECTSCTAGSYCIGEVNNGVVSGPCKAGYYCPAGSKTERQTAADEGYYAPAGASSQTICSKGYYAPNKATVSCTKCPAGYYCPSDGNTGSFTECEAGKYCPEGSYQGTPCPAGKYSTRTRLQSLSECIDCPAGKYCTGGKSSPDGDIDAGYFCYGGCSTSSDPANKCPAGFYCPSGTPRPVPCPAGRFRATQQGAVLNDCGLCTPGKYCGKSGLSAESGDCDIGYFCPGGNTSPRPSGNRCPKGQYCVAGSKAAVDCDAGTYQDSEGQGSCIPCPKGFFCAAKSLTFEGQNCAKGHYCPEGTTSSTQFKCLEGTYNKIDNAFTSDQCIACDPGHYCPSKGMVDVGPVCDPGYFCIRGAQIPNPTDATTGNKCPVGYYCPQGTAYAIPCSPGKACTSAGMSVDGVSCDAGFFCTIAATKTNPADSTEGGGPCEAGYYCPPGSSAEIACPVGTYSNAVKNTGLGDCIKCDDGYYCETLAATGTTAKCAAGYYCKKDPTDAVGFTTSRPATRICPKGYYCPEGTIDKWSCDNDKYADSLGMSACLPCPAGYYCEATKRIACRPDLDGKLSFYCPGGTRLPTSCGDGTYNNQEKSSDPNDCKPCPLGKFCPSNPTGVLVKINTCPAGNYCTGGTGTSQGIQCEQGYYCPEGTAHHIECPAGKYCPTTGMSDTDLTTKDCDAGYWCKGKAQVQNPTDGTTGVACPIGYYCPSGILEPIGCPPGTFRATPGAKTSGDCTPCTSTKYCPNRAMTAVGTDCPAGYYCPTGTAADKKFPCEPGYKCPGGSNNQVLCEDNKYQPLPVQGGCLDCPARFFCKNTDATDSVWPKICPIGKYCPAATQPIDCPAGTFGPVTGLAMESECYSCLPGKMCLTAGLTEAVTPCAAGYYCKLGVKTNPPTGATGDICPAGHYCPAGTITPIPCPPGTYNNNQGESADTACKACDARYYCPYRGGVGTTTYKIGIDSSFYCAPGYLCLGGSTTPTPTDGTKGKMCDVGKYCIAGATAETPCDPFSFNPYKGQGSCFPCPAGKYCPTSGLSTYESCPIGHYCPGGVDKVKCPAGTYNPEQGLEDSKQCYPCDPGKYCLGGKDVVDGKCSPGYVCPRGAKNQISATNYAWATPLNEGLCPPGYYCEEATKAPIPCPVGTYQDEYGKTTCKDCPVGRYCDVTGISDPSNNKCTAGYYCTGKATTKTPTSSLDGGKLCTAGFYCPEGTTVEVPCAKGSYEPREGQAVCQTCPAGFICAEGAVAPTDCPTHGYCLEGSYQSIICPDGTYSNVKNLQREEQCRTCPIGSWCKDGEVKGQCDAGYYCESGASSKADPTKQCPPGHYCLQGCLVPTICPEGKVRILPGAAAASDCSDCAAGYYCIATVPTPFDCPKGHYCPIASKIPTPCAAGYYNSDIRKTSVSDCIRCPAGHNCTVTGVSSLDEVKCPISHYCPDSSLPPVPCPNGTYADVTGFAKITDCLLCPEGFYCLVGTATPTICDEGNMCPPGSNSQRDCPAGFYCAYTKYGTRTYAKAVQCPGGFYCPVKSIVPVKCENGFYCPPGSPAAIPCPSGTMGSNNYFNDDIKTGCTTCPPGSYSLRSDDSPSVCIPCPAGYVCVYNTSSATPRDPDKDGGYECPKGFYCPEGSYEPTPCPQGYFNKDMRSKNITDCHPCEEDSYNDLEGQGGCKPCGPTSTAKMSALTCTCEGKNRVFQKADGKCVCKQYFISVMENDEEDSSYDCRPLLHERCSAGYLRDSFGKCVPQDSCESECKGGKGKRTPGMGLCECESIVDPDEVCNSTCRANAVKMYISNKGDIVFENKTAVNMSALTGVAGEPICNTGNCKLVSMTMDSAGGFKGNYGPSDTIIKAAKTQRLLTDDIRLLEASSTGISNPAICINIGDTVSFTVTKTNYPVYLKDAMANSNPDFDYSQFADLDRRIQNGEDINMFMFTFGQSGVYVLGDKSNESQQTVINVADKSQKCPNPDQYIVPITASNLLKIGVRQNEDLTLAPDWLFIGIAFIVILILLPTIIVLISYLHNQAWESKSLASIAFNKKKPEQKIEDANKLAVAQQTLNKNPTEEAPMMTHRHVIDINNRTQENGEIDPNIFEEIYKQLKEHVYYVRSEFEKKYGQDKENIARVWEQMKLLKQLMKKKLKQIAKIFGKNVKYIFSSKNGKKKDKDIKETDGALTNENRSVADELGFENEENSPEDEKSMFKDAIDAKLAADIEELSKLKSDTGERNKDFMNRFVDMQNKKLDDFKERILESSGLTEGDKQMLMKEYEVQLQNLQKQLLLDQGDAQNQLKLRLENRRVRREQLLARKELLTKQKEEVKKQTGLLLDQINNKVSNNEKSIDAEIDANVAAANNSIENKRLDDFDKLKAKYDKLIKKESDSKKAVQLMEQFNTASKELEKIYEQEKSGQLADFLKKLEEKRKERKDQLQAETKEERDSIIRLCQKQLEQIKEEEGIIYNKLVNVAIEDKVNDAKDAAMLKSKDEEQKLEKMKQAQAEELAKLETLEKEKINVIKEDEQKENEQFKIEVEAKKATLIRQTRKGCVELREKRKKLTTELALSGLSEERKAALQKELQEIDDEIKKKIEEELAKQDVEFNKMLESRKKKRMEQEAMVKKNMASQRFELDDKFLEDEEKLRAELREDRFKKSLEELKNRMSNEELPIAVEKLIEAKHMEELADMLASQYKKKAKAMSSRMGELIEQKLLEMHNVKSSLEREYTKLKELRDSDQITEADYERRMRDIHEREHDQLRNIELAYIQKGNELEEVLCKELSEKNQQDLIKLRESQLVEKNNYMSELAKNNQYARAMLSGDPRNLMSEELDEYKRQLADEKEKKIKELEARKQRLQQIAVENEDKIKAFNNETQKLLDELARREKEKIDKKKKEIEVAKKNHQESLKGITEADKQKLVSDYNAELDNLVKVMEAEQKRQAEKMMKKLEERWSAKEKLKNQKQLQLIMYKRELEEGLDSQIKDMQLKLDTKVEAKDANKKFNALVLKTDACRSVFYKRKFIAGVEMADEIAKIGTEEILEQQNAKVEDDDFAGTLLDIDFDELLKAIEGMRGRVSIFTEGNFSKLMDGFRTVNVKLNELREKALKAKK